MVHKESNKDLELLSYFLTIVWFRWINIYSIGILYYIPGYYDVFWSI